MAETQNAMKVKIEEIHLGKLKALEASFTRHQGKAIANASVNECSLVKISEDVGVHRDYFKGEKPKTLPHIAKQYKSFANSVLQWRNEFQNKKINNEIESEKIKQQNESSLLEAERDKAHMECANLVAKNERLKVQLSEIRSLLSTSQEYMIESSFQSIQRNKRSFTSFAKAEVISPDEQLYNAEGIYEFENKALRDGAWRSSREALKKLLSRNLSMRIYLLTGMPGSGKTTWVLSNNYYPDRHPIVIDATNLTLHSRMQWLSLILPEKMKLTSDIKVCAVVFDTPYGVLVQRNSKHRKIEISHFKELYENQDEVNVLDEQFDEIMIIRHT